MFTHVVDMADVANEDYREVYRKLSEWERTDRPLAPLSSKQCNIILELSEEVTAPFIPSDLPLGEEESTQISGKSISESDEPGSDLSHDFATLQLSEDARPIDSIQKFLLWCASVEQALEQHGDLVYENYRQQLSQRREECVTLFNQVEECLSDLDHLTEQHQSVANRTNSLHKESEQLLADQTKLSILQAEVDKRLQHFRALDRVSQRLSSPALSVNSQVFSECLDKLDQSIEYMSTHGKFKESYTYLAKFQHCQARALSMIRSYVVQVLQNATQQCLSAPPTPPIASAVSGATPTSVSDSDFARCYGKFQASAPRVRAVLSHIEERMQKSNSRGYETLMADCQACFTEQRELLLGAGVGSAVQELVTQHRGDHCSMVRAGCAFLLHVCQDEHQLFSQFFSTQSQNQLTDYLDGLCTKLYDVQRPVIIHINHLETLAEICSILRVEMLEEHVPANPGPLEAFGRMVWQLLQDVQERLVFRAHLYLQSDILNYKPAPGDLAYPEKLEMMESIAQSLAEQQQSRPLRRSDSRSSIASVGSATSQEVARINNSAEQPRSRTGNSPADLHGMWYPTVRRTLVCLSRLYRCVERPIFQGLSQEALSMCMQSITAAATAISQRKTPMDGELFEVKHLLILREQIAPFQVDFTIKETSLDFSKVKTAAFGLLQRRHQLFTLSSNNALLEFLLDGTPAVKEQLLDSRRDVDLRLKSTCETFINTGANSLAGPILTFVKQAQEFLKQKAANPESMKSETLKKQPFGAPETVAAAVRDTQKLIKTALSKLQRSMQLYLANRDTEAILYRPIKNNVVGAFASLQQLMATGGYSTEDCLLVACPTPEQVLVMLSSASLLAANS